MFSQPLRKFLFLTVILAVPYQASADTRSGMVLEELLATTPQSSQGIQDVSLSLNAFSVDQVRALDLFPPMDLCSDPQSADQAHAGNQSRCYLRRFWLNDYSLLAHSLVGNYQNDLCPAYTIYDVEI